MKEVANSAQVIPGSFGFAGEVLAEIQIRVANPVPYEHDLAMAGCRGPSAVFKKGGKFTHETRCRRGDWSGMTLVF